MPALTPSRSLVPALVAAIVLWLVLASEASAAFPGHNGVIAFAMNNFDRDGNGEIDTVTASGRQRRMLYSEGFGGSGTLDPNYSPSGGQIAFDTNGQGPLVPGPGEGNMEGMNSDGSGLFAVPGSGGYAPAWGPDGHSVVYASSAGVSTVDLTTGASALIAGPGASAPVWSIRNQVAYVDRGDINLVSALGGTPKRLTFKGGRQPDFFPGGGRLAFVRTVAKRGQIFTIAADGAHMRKLTDLRRRSISPAVSPNGRLIAFIHDGGRSENTANTDRLWTMRADGSRAAPVKHLPVSENGLIQFEHPSWQPLPG